LKGFPVARLAASAQNGRASGLSGDRRGQAMLTTRVMTGIGGLLFVNAVLLFIQVSTNLAVRLI
jgi:hypothetical protein